MLWRDRGYDVTLIGRTYPNPEPVERPYTTDKMRCWFNQGALFYLEYQVRLWWRLRSIRPDVYLANDLDTLAPNAYWAYRRRRPLVYDSHEYFIGVPELQGRRFVQWAWRVVERYGLPRADAHVTVNPSIAAQYFKEYGQSFEVVRNMPMIPDKGLPFDSSGQDGRAEERRRSARAALNLPVDREIWLLQGAGINVDRGAEELAQAALQRPDVMLIFVGSGDAIPTLQAQYADTENIVFVGRKPLEVLRQYTAAATLGFSLDKPLSLNYQWSLPNKLFDYWQAGIPVIASDLIEVGRVVRETGAGILVSEVKTELILEAAQAAMARYDELASAARRTAHQYHWGHAAKGWHRIIDQLEGKQTLHVWSMDRLEPPPYGGTLEVRGQIQRAADAGAHVTVHAWSKTGIQHEAPWSVPGVKFDIIPRRAMGSVKAWRIGLPWIVQSRTHRIARHRSQIQRGIALCNGAHCTAYRPINPLSILRLHNPEAAYYASLSTQAKGWRKWYYRLESVRLRRWESRLSTRWKGQVWALSPKDAEAWQSFGGHVDHIIPPLMQFGQAIPTTPAAASSLLVPGKFSVSENDAAAQLSADGIQDDCIVWAGHGLSENLQHVANTNKQIEYKEGLSDEQMQAAFSNASAVLIHSEHVLGVKLKLIQALEQARWIIAHEYSVEGLGIDLESCAIITYRDASMFQSAWLQVKEYGWDAERAEHVKTSRAHFLAQCGLPKELLAQLN